MIWIAFALAAAYLVLAGLVIVAWFRSEQSFRRYLDLVDAMSKDGES